MFWLLRLAVSLVFLKFGCSNDFETSGDFNVMDYGATSNGQIDDSQAFLDAWNAACRVQIGYARVIVPPRKLFLVHPIIFQGPCRSPIIHFMISGTIVAPYSTALWNGKDGSQWLVFKDVTGLVIDGFGYINGRGEMWWNQSCKYRPHIKQCTKLAPTVLKVLSCDGSNISSLYILNSAQTHILMKGCNGFFINNVVIHSPATSPNTDGIHVQSSHHGVISNSKIGSGDDCISVGDHTSNIQILNVQCGPGHGISIGSLGKGGNYVQVERIHVINALLNGTSNGARIKTWQVGRGYVRDIMFENLIFHHVKNPIVIDQNYCDIRNACKDLETGVQISNVIYRKISGTSCTSIAINLNCSRSVPRFDVSMESIKLTSSSIGKQVTSKCNNAYGQEIDVHPNACLSNLKFDTIT